MKTAVPRPRLYGYFRVLDSMDDADVREARQTLADFAGAGGFDLVDIYEDGAPGYRLQVWLDMVNACRAEAVPALVAVSMDSFHPDPALAEFMREELAQKIQGTVFIADRAPGEADRDG
ncbi:serine integrase family protein [Actinacidiphila bryophytorum]|uniref:hypothetical protein n=1 Tax=Actinacidiphila bryophytorum TaxID=1436133 RepID=UPI002176D407|nr:hypothetical protein [Actinacidiphila bryophytorum]UWE12067.1 hypothetical protein NYE86_27500 [Actinacidiphila bryophytorum]